jgi:hypothetical protein
MLHLVVAAFLSQEILCRTFNKCKGVERTMGYPPPDISEQLHAHDLQLILRSTHSLLSHHSSHIKNGRSLRILDLALLTAIADLQQLEAIAFEAGHPVFLKPS